MFAAAVPKVLVTVCGLESPLEITGDEDFRAVYPNFGLAANS